MWARSLFAIGFMQLTIESREVAHFDTNLSSLPGGAFQDCYSITDSCAVCSICSPSLASDGASSPGCVPASADSTASSLSERGGWYWGVSASRVGLVILQQQRERKFDTVDGATSSSCACYRTHSPRSVGYQRSISESRKGRCGDCSCDIFDEHSCLHTAVVVVAFVLVGFECVGI